MAQSKSSAAQTQLGIGQQQLAVFDQIAQSAKFVIQQSADARKTAADIWQGVASTAQRAKEMEINSYFKERELELRSKQLDVESRLTDRRIAAQEYGLQLEGDRNNIARDRLNYDMQRQQDAEKYKGYASAASKAGASILSKGRLDYAATDGRIKFLEDRRSKLTAAEKLLRGPDIDRELGELVTKRSTIEADLQRGELYQQEAMMVTAGAEPGSVISLPGFKFDSNNTSPTGQRPSPNSGINPALPGESGGMSSALFPSIDGPTANAANSALQELGIEGAVAPSGPDRLIGQEHVGTYYSPPSRLSQGEMNRVNSQETEVDPFDPEWRASNNTSTPSAPTFTRNQIIGTLNSIPDDAKDYEYQVAQVISLADPETKAFIGQQRSIIETDFLLNIGSLTNYSNIGQPEDATKAIQNSMSEYRRFGGDQMNISALQREARSAITNIRTDLLAETMSETDNTLKYYYQPESRSYSGDFDRTVAAKYNEWVMNRGKEVQQSQEASKSDAIKTGVNLNGSLNGDIARTLSQDTPATSDNIGVVFSGVNTDIASATAIGNENRKQIIDEIETFRKDFVFTEGENKGRIKNSFINFVAENSEKLYRAENRVTEFGLTQEQKKQLKEDAKQYGIQAARDALNNRMTALDLWRKIKSL